MNNRYRVFSILAAISLLFSSSIFTFEVHASEEGDTEIVSEENAENSEEAEQKVDTRIIPKGISIEGTDVSGMTVTEADQVVSDYFAKYADVNVTLNANEQTISAKGADICLCAKNADVTSKAATLGKSGNFAERFMAKTDLDAGRGKDYKLSVAADASGLTLYLDGVANQVNDDASDNSLERKDGQFVFKKGKSGVVVVVDESAKLISDYVENSWDGSDMSFDLITEVKEPRGTADELEQITDLIGSYSTDFSSSSSARANNVSNGASHINGTILFPGDEFSVLSAITPFSAENGYELAGSYENGTTVETYGGGICQVSTTLYGAVREAELEIVTRSCHSMVVTYVEPSQDAAISESGSKDFQIKNNKNYPVYIEGFTSGGMIYFNIYGKEEDEASHSVDYETEITEVNVQNTTWVADESLALGVMSTATSGHTGYKARLWKIILENGEEVDRYVYNNSTYNPSNRTVRVGVGTDNAALKGAMISAVSTQDANTIASAIATYAPGVSNSTPFVIKPKYSVTVKEEESENTQDAGSTGDATQSPEVPMAPESQENMGADGPI